MTAFLMIAAIVACYAFIGGMIGARHHAIVSRPCSHNSCFSTCWCGHVYMSVYLMGILWPIGLPVAGGILIGKTNKSDRVERRRAFEIEAAKHQAELARLRRLENEELDRQLNKA